MFYQQVISIPIGKFNHPPTPFLKFGTILGCPPRYKFFVIFFLPHFQPLMFFRLKLSVIIGTF